MPSSRISLGIFRNCVDNAKVIHITSNFKFVKTIFVDFIQSSKLFRLFRNHVDNTKIIHRTSNFKFVKTIFVDFIQRSRIIPILRKLHIVSNFKFMKTICDDFKQSFLRMYRNLLNNIANNSLMPRNFIL